MHLASVTVRPERFPVRDRYPFCLPQIQTLGRVAFDAPVTFFVGENGSGKSTLLEAIAHGCGIHLWRDDSRRRAVHNPHERRLADHLEVEWTAGKVPGSFFGADIFRNFAAILDEWAAADPGQLEYFGGRSLLTLSHGQSLLAFFASRYRIPGLYLLDEPESALSPRSQVELLRILAREGGAGHAQFIVATHSPILLACPGAAILSFDEAPPRRVALAATDTFRLYREFLADPGRVLAHDRGRDAGAAEAIVAGYVPGCIGRVAELHGAYYHEHWGFGVFFEARMATEIAALFNRFDPARHGFWTVSAGGRVEASVAIDGSEAAERGAHLRWFIISDALRGRGLGNRLLDTAVGFCRERGFPRVDLWTFAGLDAARHLYEKAGFRLAEETRGRQWGVEVTEQRFELSLR